MSFRGWNTDWAITWGMRCSVMFIRVKTSSKEEGMIAFTRGRSSQCLGLYQHVSEASQKWLSKAFIQRSVMPHQRLSKLGVLRSGFLRPITESSICRSPIPTSITIPIFLKPSFFSVYNYTPIKIFRHLFRAWISFLKMNSPLRWLLWEGIFLIWGVEGVIF